MSRTTKIIDGTGTGYEAKVDVYNTLWVRDIGIPPTSDPDAPAGSPGRLNIQSIYREFLTLDGAGVVSDARVNGSVSNQLFYVGAESDSDIYVTSLSFVLADANATLSSFGALAALTNGLNLYYEDDNGVNNIGTNLRTNFDLVRLSQGNPAWGDPTSAFIASNVVGNSEAIIPILDFRRVFGLPYGIKLSANSTNKIVLQVRDNITAVDQFDVIAYGTRVRIRV